MRRGQSKQDYATPPDFMDAVRLRYGPISFDLAAHAGNTKHERYYTEENNSLVQPWHKLDGLLWLNPPFADIAPWAAKCAQESRLGARILFLVPASVGSNWFRDHVYGHAAVSFLNGRISFDGIAPYPKDCLLAYYCGGTAMVGVWTWRLDLI